MEVETINALISAARKEDQARIAELEGEVAAAAKETGDLREAVTTALEMPWIEMPQPLGGVAHRCPDDVDIIAALRSALAGSSGMVAVELERLRDWRGVLLSLTASDRTLRISIRPFLDQFDQLLKEADDECRREGRCACAR